MASTSTPTVGGTGSTPPTSASRSKVAPTNTPTSRASPKTTKEGGTSQRVRARTALRITSYDPFNSSSLLSISFSLASSAAFSLSNIRISSSLLNAHGGPHGCHHDENHHGDAHHHGSHGGIFNHLLCRPNHGGSALRAGHLPARHATLVRDAMPTVRALALAAGSTTHTAPASAASASTPAHACATSCHVTTSSLQYGAHAHVLFALRLRRLQLHLASSGAAPASDLPTCRHIARASCTCLFPYFLASLSHYHHQ